MKKLRCPKCDMFISFNDADYGEGQTLVFECPHCGKQFSIRIKKKTEGNEISEDDFGYVLILENIFGFEQKLKLTLGDNIIGRYNKGTDINQPIRTNDPSIDRIHCIINISRNKKGELVYTLRDASSITGTFLKNEIIGAKDRIRISDGSIITIGAATMILHIKKEK